MSEVETPVKAAHSNGQAPQSKDQPKAAPSKFTPEKRKQLFMGLGVLAVVLLSYFVYETFMYVSTDNASVQAHATLLSSQVRGIITRADVEENQKVKEGQVLVEIKQDDYEQALEQKQADAASLAAQLHGAQLNYARTLDLFKKGASTKERLDSAEAQFKSLESKFKSAQAEAEEAKLNVGYTKITAPRDGKVGRRSFEVGMLAAPGQPLLGFVANDERWVTANLKETDMANVVEGNKAYVEVDAIPGRQFEGVVESISPATGATFTLLPPDNATGNFTKVVQRVPVRIKLLNLTEHDMDRLQNGLSAEVKIRVH
jgi:membrane fusion protein (multidrug efflux system)